MKEISVNKKLYIVWMENTLVVEEGVNFEHFKGNTDKEADEYIDKYEDIFRRVLEEQ